MFQFNPDRLHSTHVQSLIAGLADIARVAVGELPSPDAMSFLSTYDRFRQTSNHARTRVLLDPRTAIWANGVQAMLAENGLSALSSKDWNTQLRDFGRFLLGARMIDQQSESVQVPVDKCGVISVPGTDLVLILPERTGTSAQVSIKATGQVSVEGNEVQPVRLHRFGPFQLAGEEAALDPPIADLNRPLKASDTKQEDWLAPLSRAVDLVRRHPDSWDLASRFATVIVPINDSQVQTHCSITFSSIPGAIYMSWSPDARVLAEAVVHEADHQLLYTLTQFTPLWAEALERQEAVFRSPWRDDPRPLDGMIRGASAFVRVGVFWTELLLKAKEIEEESDWLGGRALLCIEQSLDAIDLIKSNGKLSTDGADFLQLLKTQSRQAHSTLCNQSGFSRWTKSARFTQDEHNAAWQARNHGQNRVNDCKS